MSADPPNSKLPARSRPALSELSKQTTEEDLWNLDEGASSGSADTAGQASPPSAAGGPARQPEPTAAPEKNPAAPAKTKPVVIEARLEKPASEKKSVTRKESARSKVKDAFDSLDGESGEAPEAADPVPPSPETGEPPDETPSAEDGNDEISAAAPARPSAPQTASGWGLNRRETIGLGAFFFVLLLVAIWGLAGFFGHLHFAGSGDRTVKFPVKGERAVIAAADSFWREPVREGPGRDAARNETVMIPVVELSLAPESGSGALRLLFRNDRGDPVGDTITRTFSGGKFDVNGTEKTECASTEGFSENGEFNAYQAGHGDPWTVLVLEGPGPDAPAKEFSTLFELPLSTLRR